MGSAAVGTVQLPGETMDCLNCSVRKGDICWAFNIGVFCDGMYTVFLQPECMGVSDHCQVITSYTKMRVQNLSNNSEAYSRMLDEQWTNHYRTQSLAYCRTQSLSYSIAIVLNRCLTQSPSYSIAIVLNCHYSKKNLVAEEFCVVTPAGTIGGLIWVWLE